MVSHKKIHAFTSRYPHLSAVLQNTIKITPTGTNIFNIDDEKYVTESIWDTGATHSAITVDMVNRLDLVPTGMTYVQGVHGKKQVYKYTVDIILPNRIIVPGIPVTGVDGLVGEVGALIGMDIITLGDFSVSNFNKKTTFSFRIPSCEEIDFIPKAEDINMKSDGLNRAQRRKISKKKKK